KSDRNAKSRHIALSHKGEGSHSPKHVDSEPDSENPKCYGDCLVGRHFLGPLTVKLNGRAEAPDWRRGRTISSSARGAQPPAHHGPFQRWLEDAPTSLLCARGIFSANRNWPTQRTPIAQRRHSRDKAQPLAPALHAGLTGRPRAHKRKR